MTKKNPFEPPKPPIDDDDGFDVHLGVVVASTTPSRIGTVDFDVMHDLRRSFDAEAHLGTQAPERNGKGHVQCARCNHFVPYASMSLSEDGAFCTACADALIAEAQDS